MKRMGTAAIILCGLAIGSFALAGVIENIDMEAGIEIGDFHYRESHIMREDGVQGGIYGSIAILAVRPWYFQFYGSYVGGDVKYDGGYGSGRNYHELTGDTSNYIVNGRGIAGFMIGEDGLCIMPYSGLGYRYLRNDLNDLTIAGVVNGYLREQVYLYLPLGLDISLPLGYDGKWTIGLKSEFDWMFYGENKSGGTELKNQDGYGFRFIPYVRLDVSEQLALKLEVFGEYWNINKSDVNNGILEPDNASNYYGARGGICF